MQCLGSLHVYPKSSFSRIESAQLHLFGFFSCVSRDCSAFKVKQQATVTGFDYNMYTTRAEASGRSLSACG